MGDAVQKAEPSQSFVVRSDAPAAPIRTAADAESLPEPVAQQGLTRSEIDDSLKGIDEDHGDSSKKKRHRGERRRWSFGRIVKYVVLLLVVILIGIGGYLGYKALSAGSSIFKGNILDAFTKNEPLKQDANGRSNILVLGTSEDDPGHQGADLTDSIMILSVDQNNKNAYMISIPRDMEVQYGQACTSGYAGKINGYFSCVRQSDSVEDDRQATLDTAKLLSEVTGIDIQYGVHVNYTVMRDVVNAVGNITVTIDSRDPHGQMDSNFDWKCGATYAARLKACPPNGHFIDYPNGPVELDAEHALYLAQARGDIPPTYGFEQSNFDREKNQQKIIKAIREKAVSAGVLSDPTKVNALIDALGNNLRTTFEASEVKTLLSLATDIKSEDIHSISLIDGDQPIMAGDGNPVAGKYNFTALRAFLKKSLSSNPAVREGAKITVLNGSGVAGVAQTEADKLTNGGFTVNAVDNAPDGTYDKVEIYQIGDGMSATKAKLQSLYGVTVKTTSPPVSVAPGTNFVVVFGKASAASTN